MIDAYVQSLPDSCLLLSPICLLSVLFPYTNCASVRIALKHSMPTEGSRDHVLGRPSYRYGYLSCGRRLREAFLGGGTEWPFYGAVMRTLVVYISRDGND